MMYNPDVFFDGEEYIQTSTGNRISRKSDVCKPQLLEIPNGRVIIKTGAIVRCDFAAVCINKYSMICEGCILRPPNSVNPTNFKFIPVNIGSHCYIGKNCVIEAAVIGSGCFIGDNSIISQRVVMRDFVYVEPNTVVPPDMVLPPFAIVAGNPAVIVGEMPESTSTLASRDAVARYKSFKLKI